MHFLFSFNIFQPRRIVCHPGCWDRRGHFETVFTILEHEVRRVCGLIPEAFLGPCFCCFLTNGYWPVSFCFFLGLIAVWSVDAWLCGKHSVAVHRLREVSRPQVDVSLAEKAVGVGGGAVSLETRRARRNPGGFCNLRCLASKQILAGLAEFEHGLWADIHMRLNGSGDVSR